MKQLGKIFVLMSLVLLFSCSSDDDSDGLSGYYTEVEWLTEMAKESIEDKSYDSDGFCAGATGFEFRGSTVETSRCYVYAKEKSNAYHTATVSGQTIYFVKKPISTCEYFIEGNTLYMTDGTIGTISGNAFYIEGQRKFTKLN